MFAFGTDFTLTFTPFVDDQEVANMPATTAKALIYTSKPSRSDVIAETGYLATYSTTWVAGATSASFAVTSIDDPSPSSEAPTETYYAAFKFKLDIDEDYQIVLERLYMQRARGQIKTVSVSKFDLTDIFSAIASYASDEDIHNAINVENLLLRARLKARGYDWALTQRQDWLKNAVVFGALALLTQGESLQDGDRFDKLSKQYRESANSLLNGIAAEIPYDADADGEADSKLSGTGFAIAIR